MTKIAIITDTHFGIRSDSVVFLDYFKKFLDEVFFPTLKLHNVRTVLHGGDLVDRRKTINFYTAKRMREDFLEKLIGYNVHFIAGNHDVSYKTTNDVNCYSELLKKQGIDLFSDPLNFSVSINPEHVYVEGKPFLLLPWICPANEKQAVELIAQSTAKVVLGHLELSGFEMFRGSICDHGLDYKQFQKFDTVLTGHFHHKSKRYNIDYLGAPWEMTWSDYNDERGFHLFDLETHELTFIKNPYSMFNVIEYNNLVTKSSDLDDMNLDRYTGSYVKIVIKKSDSPYYFDMFKEHLEGYNPIDIKIVDTPVVNLLDESELIDEAKDTVSILRGYVNQLGTETDKPKLEKLLVDLYIEALVCETA